MAIPLTCSSCDYEFKVKDELAGKRIKCPKCKEVMTVLAAEDEPEPEEPEEDERPKKKKKKKGKKNNRVLIGSAIGGGVLVVGIVLYFVFFAGGGNANQNKVVQKKVNQPVPKPAVQEAVVEDEPKIQKKAPAGAAARIREATEIQNMLRQLGIAYTQFEASENRGPKDQKELGPYYQNINPINESLTNKWITFIWAASSKDFPEGKSNTILAYETEADRAGNRFALMGDGSVQSLDEATFQKTPKAKGK